MKILHCIFNLYKSLNMDLDICKSKLNTKQYWCNKCVNYNNFTCNTIYCASCIKTIGIPSNYRNISNYRKEVNTNDKKTIMAKV